MLPKIEFSDQNQSELLFRCLCCCLLSDTHLTLVGTRSVFISTIIIPLLFHYYYYYYYDYDYIHYICIVSIVIVFVVAVVVVTVIIIIIVITTVVVLYLVTIAGDGCPKQQGLLGMCDGGPPLCCRRDHHKLPARHALLSTWH